MTKHVYAFILATVLSLAGMGQAEAITRQQLASYAASLKGKKKAELKTALYNLMKDKTVLDYGSGSGCTWSGFYQTDRDPKTNECYNRYSSKKFYFSDGNTNHSISGMNIEHSFPKSWWGGAENDAYKDLYNLYPSDSKANSSKSNYPMAVVTNVKTQEPGYDKVGTGTVDGKSGTNCWEPGDKYKGDFSRSYMYMGVTYSNLTFVKTGIWTMYANASGYPGMRSWATTLYRQWSKQDKVDDLEVTRNNAVAKIQGNRNLFIDFPFLAEYVWGDSVDVAFDPSRSISTASDDNRYGSYTPGGDDSDEPVNPDEPDDPDEGSYIFVKITKQPTAGKRYLIVANNGGNLIAAKPLSGSRSYGYLYGDGVTEKSGRITLSSASDAFTFESAGSGFYMKGSDGKYYYNDKSHKNFNVSTSKPSDNVWTFSSRGDGTYTISNGSNFIQYSTQYTSFGAYTSAQSGGLYPSLYEEQDATPTAIETIVTPATEPADDAVYNLQGVRVDGSRLLPGIYVKGGKKFVVR